METWKFLVTALVIHVVFFYSIFDVYFTSPLVHGMTPVISNTKPPAKRLVLFVADGLRADKFFERESTGQSRAPFLRDVIEKTGCWGISHTRVPTESRPGHVAVIAGFYEDVSAVAKGNHKNTNKLALRNVSVGGWKENPVEFDSVFNESRYTWSWGSPDILPMFAKGATGDHVFMDYYPSENEDFAASDSSKLDTWVFDKVKVFLESAKSNENLKSMLNRDKVVFFLHLLGLDTNGHSHKPYSMEYINNIRLVDEGIKNIAGLLDDFYEHDGKTAYVFTSDHGMTNWGSHGAGHQSETLTPLVVWGAGVRQAQDSRHNTRTYEDKFSREWTLSHVRRVDVQQADIAALMSVLLGLAYPVNSVGTLPLDVLDMSDSEKAEVIFANAQQMVAQYEVKMKQKKSTTLALTFRPFSDLTEDQQIFKIRNIKNLIKSGLYQNAIEESHRLIESALEGLNYYQKYDRLFLGVSICSGFVGWILYVLTLVLREHAGIAHDRTYLEKLQQLFYTSDVFIEISSGLAGLVIIVLLAVQSLPLTNYVYCLIPVILWMSVFKRWYVFRCAVEELMANNMWGIIIAVIVCVFGLEILIAGFFHRELLSVGLLCMGLWPLTNTAQLLSNKMLYIGWILSCVVMAIFPLLPVVGRDVNYTLVICAGLLMIILAMFSVLRTKENGAGNVVNYVQILLILVSTFLVNSTAASISRDEGLPLLNQICSWVILCLSFFLPICGSTNLLNRLLTIALAFFPSYQLLSISQETLFIVCICCVLYFWLKLEHSLNVTGTKQATPLESIDFVRTETSNLRQPQRHLVVDDIRRAFFYIFFILAGFFGTGNIASINSFEPASVYCFLTVFNPFVMGGLMMLKNVLPLILVSCVFRAIHVTTHIPTRALFLLVLIMSDFMALNFFFMVKDYGSWLEIGTSISHFVIVMCMNLFLMILFVLSHILTTRTIRSTKMSRS